MASLQGQMQKLNLRPAGTFLCPTLSQWTVSIPQQMTTHLHDRKSSSHKFHHHFSNSVISMGSTPLHAKSLMPTKMRKRHSKLCRLEFQAIQTLNADMTAPVPIYFAAWKLPLQHKNWTYPCSPLCDWNFSVLESQSIVLYLYKNTLLVYLPEIVCLSYIYI